MTGVQTCALPISEQQRYETEKTRRNLKDLLDQIREQNAAATTPQQSIDLHRRAADIQARLDALPPEVNVEALQKALKKYQTKWEDAKEKGDTEQSAKFAQDILDVQNMLAKHAAPEETGMFAPAAMQAQAEREQQIADEMAQGRAPARVARERAAVQPEIERAQAERDAQAQAEGQLEREVLTDKARMLASNLRARELEPLRTAAQLSLLPEEQTRETVTRSADTGVTTRVPSTVLGAAPASIQPQAPLLQRLATLATRVLASPRLSTDTRALVQQVQDVLPQLVRNAPGDVTKWLYQTEIGRAHV